MAAIWPWRHFFEANGMDHGIAPRRPPRRERRWRLIVSMALAAVVLGSGAFAAPFDDAMAAMRERDWRTAMALLHPLAERGDPRAQRTLGLLHDNTAAPDMRDMAQSVFWYGKAAEQGDAEAESSLGFSYIDGRGVPADPARGLALMTTSVSHGDVHSAFLIGQMYRHGLSGLPKDEGMAVAWYRVAAELGDNGAQTQLGIAYEHGAYGLAKDLIEANFWYRRAGEALLAKAVEGDAMSQSELGLSHENGIFGFARNGEAALAWYRRSLRGDAAMDRSSKDGIARVERGMASGSGGASGASDRNGR
jgi:TPR repeat protein